jgi:two-component system nitrate/nitrite response regulator NarL
VTTRILVADDHPMIRTALDVLLRGTDFILVGQAGTGAETIEAVRDKDPDIVLLDVRMPDGSGIDVLKKIRDRGDQRRIVLLTAGITDGALIDALELGVDGIVLKNADPAFLLECLETVRIGGVWIDPDLKGRVQELEAKADSRPSLAPREKQLIALVRKGLRNREIAKQLGVTEGTVKVYLHAIFDKVEVANRTELAIKADDLIGPDSPGS